jgi:hypothetical protein
MKLFYEFQCKSTNSHVLSFQQPKIRVYFIYSVTKIKSQINDCALRIPILFLSSLNENKKEFLRVYIKVHLWNPIKKKVIYCKISLAADSINHIKFLFFDIRLS